MLVIAASAVTASAANKPHAKVPWMDTRLSPDRRADLVIQQMTLDEKIQLLHGSMAMHIDRSDKQVRVSFQVKNTGPRAGAEVAQIYLGLPSAAEEPPKRLVGWQKVTLQPGETRSITVAILPRMLAIFDVPKDDWKILPGQYQISVGGSSRQLPLHASFNLQASQTLAP